MSRRVRKSLIVIVALAVISGLIFAGFYFTVTTERVKFWTESFLSASVLAAIIVQAYVYFRQRDEMQRQREAMDESLKRTGKVIDTMTTEAGIMAAQAEIMRQSFLQTKQLVGQNASAMKIAERSAKAAEDSVEIAHRAYVLADKASPEYSTDTLIIVMFQITNFGNTPARNVRIWSRAEVRDAEPDSIGREEVDWEDNAGLLIPPRCPIDRRMTVNITVEQRHLLNDRKLSLYLWGLMQYKDIFGHTRHTEFKFVHRPGMGPRFGHCQSGNEAD